MRINFLKFRSVLKVGVLSAISFVFLENVSYSQTPNINQQIPSMSQINSVSSLRDFSPNDWAYEALRNLVERYGCIVGYPDGTFRGNRALSRYEFAAGLNACIQQIERLIAKNETLLKEDLDILIRLTKELETELITLGARVDNLEGRVAFLEDNQFSTTTQLRGEVIFSPYGAFGSATKADSDESLDDQIAFAYRSRLNLYTSFSGKDRLKVRLRAGNFYGLDDATGTDMARLSYHRDTDNDVTISDVIYRFPVGKNVKISLGGNGFSTKDISNLHNPVLDSSSSGVLSRFHYRNPAVFRNSASQGLGANIKFNDVFDVELAYLTGNAENPQSGNGLFNGDYTAFSQLNIQPADNFGLGIAVAYSYYPSSEVNFSGSTGSDLARRPFGRVPTSGLRVGLQTDWQVTENIALAAWGGYINAEAKGGINKSNTADIWNWSANVSFLDLAKEGDFFAIAGGMPPKATYIKDRDSDRDTSYTIEALYRYPLNDNIAVTPGFYVVLNPNHNANNGTIWVGAIRTTFKF